MKAALTLTVLTLLVGENALSKGSASTVRTILLSHDAGVTVLTVETDGKAFFGYTEILVPHRVFIDIKGASLSGDVEMPVEKTAAVSKTVVEEFDEGILGNTTRVTLHITAPVKIKKQSSSKKHLTITITPEGKLPPQPPVPAAKAEKKEKTTPKAAKTKTAAPSKKAGKAGKAKKPSAAAAKPEESVFSKTKSYLPVAKKKKSALKSTFIGSEDPSIYDFGEKKTAGAFASVPKQVSLAKKKKKPYTGKKIDLDFKDADIHNILRLLSTVGNINIVVGDEVKGSVTLSMSNVPWNLALDVILEAKNLGKVKIAENVYRVAQKETLEKEREMKIKELKNKKILKPLITRIIPVSYAMVEDLKQQAEGLLSIRGSVCLLYTSPSPRDVEESRMPSSA